ncbi:coiled-coil domain-containing protein 24 [Hippoglossus hippoglossus]|uniref:coiled-coil domain-containing protein 24 n=1 Tax=Hippoglossus hippoglossus TaxID=8267 RepID=UPI00148DCBFA|nr:coiled-coil domain-containing protein 24 [Hippoglossus hippoglossus]
MQSPDESQLWCRGPSLWSLISEHVPGSELSKIRMALGHFLVDMYTEVHTEAEIWYEMWQESQRGGGHGSRAGAPLPRQQGSPLADPPAVKELVRAEVKMLLQMLRERAGREGRDGEELLFRYKPETVNYALGHFDRRYRDCTSPGDTENGSRPSSCCSVQSSAEDEIEAVRDKLNVIDIDQVVDRLRSVLMEECEVLKRLVQDLKKNIKQKFRSRSDFEKSEPSLAELRELRGEIQMDLELYPSSLATSSPASPSLPVKELKTRFRRSTGRKASDETLQAFHSASVPRPHPPAPLCQPRPPAGPPPTKTSASRTHGSTLASNVSSRPPICLKLTTSRPVNSHFTSDVTTIKSDHNPHLSPEQHSAGVHCRPPKAERNSPVHEAQISSHRSLSREDDLPQKERKSSSRHISVTPSHIPALSPVSDAGSHYNSRTDQAGSTLGKSETPNGQRKSTCGGGVVSADDEERRKRTPGSFYSSVMSETGSRPSRNGDRKGNSRIDRYKISNLQKGITLGNHHLTAHSSSHSESNCEQEQLKAAIQPASVQLEGKVFTFPKRPLGGATSQPAGVEETQTEPAINRFHQPAPPSRVST